MKIDEETQFSILLFYGLVFILIWLDGWGQARGTSSYIYPHLFTFVFVLTQRIDYKRKKT